MRVKKEKKAGRHIPERVIIPSEREFIWETLKATSFNSKQDFVDKVIEKMNEGKPRKFYDWKEPGQKFLGVKCRICKNFQLRFAFKKAPTSGAITDITFVRTINMGHIKEKHSQGDF